MDTNYLRRQIELAVKYNREGRPALVADCLSRALDALSDAESKPIPPSEWITDVPFDAADYLDRPEPK